MSKLIKLRYEYYKGTTEIVDNELDTFVDDAVDRLNEQDFNKKELLKVKQDQDKQIADLQHKLEEKEKEIKTYRQREYILMEQLSFVSLNVERLEKQLKSQPAEIVKEIKKGIKDKIICFWKDADRKDFNEILNTILKKYGGKDE